jgi:hypothetical protein
MATSSKYGEFSSKYIAGEYSKLLSEVNNIDERLEDFKILLKKAVSYDADYSLDGLKYVELLLKHLKPTVENDKDLLIESALYIGETVKRTFNAKWSISDDKDNLPDVFGQPIITGHSSYEDFYPFDEINNFIANPTIGYFKKLIQQQIKPG